MCIRDRAHTAWAARKATHLHAAAFDAAIAPPDARAVTAAFAAYKAELSATAPKVATRKASELSLIHI